MFKGSNKLTCHEISQLTLSKIKVSNNFYPSNYASKNTRKFALVVEGGGMRTIFAAGVLDSFHENNFDPFTLYLGVSAGSLSLASHLAGDYLRNYRVLMHCALRRNLPRMHPEAASMHHDDPS